MREETRGERRGDAQMKGRGGVARETGGRALACSGMHRGDFCELQAQQPNGLRPFFSALETFFFAGLSEWNLKKIWINSKKTTAHNRMVLDGPVGTLPSAPASTAPQHPTKQFQHILEFGYMHRNSVIFSVLAPATKSRTLGFRRAD